VWRRFILLALVFVSCTYSFNPSRYSHIRSIAIPVFLNETVKYGLAESLTERLIEAFMEDGRLRIREEESADALLEGTVINYEKSPFIYDEYEEVSSYRVVVGIEVKLTDMTKDRTLWVRQFAEWSHYPADGEEDEGVDQTLDKLRERLIREINEGW
jgi:hypothetical protein